jgi:hypothetical protein
MCATVRLTGKDSSNLPPPVLKRERERERERERDREREID